MAIQTKIHETYDSNVIWHMRELAQQKNAIDMSLEMTEFNCSEKLAALASKYIREDFNNYAPMEGCLSLREQISKVIEKRYRKTYNPETEVTVCSSVVQAATTVISALIKEGDEVIIPDPVYFAFGQAVRLNGGMPVFFPLKEPGFGIDWETFRKMITPKTKLIILCNPLNPTGTKPSREDMLQLERLTGSTGIFILSDETYENLSYDEGQHQSMSQFSGLASRSFILSNPGSQFHINGWGLAWCVAPAEMMKEFRKINENNLYSCPAPLQKALAEYWPEADESAEDIAEFYQGKRNYFNRLLKGSPYLIEPSQGTYFQLINYKNLSDESDVDFALRLIDEAGVAAMPLSRYMHKPRKTQYLRFCFAKKNATLDEVAARLLKFAEKIKRT